MEEPIIQPFTNVQIVDLPVAEDMRFGENQLREVMEFQIGSANNESNPKIWRCDQSGQWMGQKKFIIIPNEPINRKRIKYQVDMNGNITATSFKTAGDGKRVRIIDNQIEIYDIGGNLRVVMNDGFLTFYAPNGTLIGDIAGFDSPNKWLFNSPVSMFFMSGDNLILDAVNNIDGRVNGNIFFVLSQLLDIVYCNRVLNLVALPADPLVGIDGAMFYADPTHPTDPDEFRVLKAGTWRNMITT